MPVLKKLATLSKLLRQRDFYHVLTHRGRKPAGSSPNLPHAFAAVDWLLTANAVCGGRGFSKLYSLKNGWFGPYAETTGYIIATLHDFVGASDHRRDEVTAAINSSVEFLLGNQYPGGAFGDSWSNDPLVYDTRSPMVFDTGQVIFGLLACHRAGGNPRSLESARRAGDWLLSIQEEDGSWKRFTYSNRARTYYSRSAHSLAELWQATGDERYRVGALRQLEWVVAQQNANGSFRNCSFESDRLTVLHVIAYTLDGLWKAGEILDREEFRGAARRGAVTLARVQERSGILAGHYDPEWNVSDPASCLTGLAQMAEVWMLVHRADGDASLLAAADTALEYLKQKQFLDPSRPNLYGGLTGSYPWNGRYFPWAIPNWPQKFFIDALLLRERIRTAGG